MKWIFGFAYYYFVCLFYFFSLFKKNFVSRVVIYGVILVNYTVEKKKIHAKKRCKWNLKKINKL